MDSFIESCRKGKTVEWKARKYLLEMREEMECL